MTASSDPISHRAQHGAGGAMPGHVRSWQPDSFGDSARPQRPLAPTATQMEDMYEQARLEGYAQGRIEGIEAGHGQVQAEAQRMLQLAERFAEELLRADDQVAQDLVDLALELARRMIGQALSARPELLVAVVQDAAAMLPPFSEAPRVVLHPDDVALVREHLGPQIEQGRWKLHSDANQARGGCRVETVASEIDASLAKRWEHLTTALGRRSEWLA